MSDRPGHLGPCPRSATCPTARTLQSRGETRPGSGQPGGTSAGQELRRACPVSGRADVTRGGSRTVDRPEVSGGRTGHSSGCRPSGHAVPLSTRCAASSARVRRGPAPSPRPREHGSKGEACFGEGPPVMSDIGRPLRVVHNVILNFSWKPAWKLNSWDW